MHDLISAAENSLRNFYYVKRFQTFFDLICNALSQFNDAQTSIYLSMIDTLVMYAQYNSAHTVVELLCVRKDLILSRRKEKYAWKIIKICVRGHIPVYYDIAYLFEYVT